MAVLWSDYRTYIRRSILKDTATGANRKWSDDQLRDMLWWALDTFCVHTAAFTSAEILPVVDTLAYDLPDNLFESPEVAGAVYAVSSDSRVYYKPMFRQAVDDTYAFYVTGNNSQINFLEVPEQDVQLLYYAYYNHPTQDSDTVDIPAWGLAPLAYLIGAFAMSPESVTTGNIRQYGENPDRGIPTDNPMIQQQNTWLKLYDNLMNRFKAQNRTLIVGFD